MTKLPATLVMGLIAAFTPWEVDAATCSVPSGAYPNIQSAVNDPACTTIMVAPGAYLEDVTISRPLTLLGPNNGTSWNGSRGPEAVVTGVNTFNLLNGQGVTIDGFHINGSFAVYVAGSSTGTTIENNIISGTTRALTLDAPGSNANVLNNSLASPIRSMHLSNGPYTNLDVNGNRFSGDGDIFFSGNSAITGFAFNSNSVEHYANIASNITNGVVSGNVFNAPVGSALDLQISLHQSTMTNNLFEGNDANACLQLFGSQFALVPSHDVAISENIFRNCGGPAPPWNFAIQLSPDIFNVEVTNNTITNGFEGVNTRDATPWTVSPTIHVNFNNITDNTSFGVRNGQLMGVLNAECNWWGSASGPGPVGPGTGDNVSTNVDYTPWLIAPAPGGRCLGGVPSTPGKATGGGQIEGDPVFSLTDQIFNPLGTLVSVPAVMPSVSDPNGRASFGFVVKCCAVTGNLEYKDHAMDVRIKARSVDRLIISSPGTSCPAAPGSKHATFTGMADVIRSTGTTSEPFTVDADDCGEPGTNDTFGIQTTTYSNGPKLLIGGNIQIR